MPLINYEKLTWVLTKQGINQIREVLADPDKTLNLTQFKFGDANGTFYEPTGRETGLVNQCTDSNGNLVYAFVIDKSINVVNFIDSQNNLIEKQAVVISSMLPEESCDYEIMEVGLYGEDVNGDEYLFALSTCSPIPKPNIEDNYAISLNYSAYFISSNLLAIYDRIQLNPNNQYVSYESLIDLADNMLYVTGNLAEQINDNSHILGLNRTEQLNEKINDNLNNSMLFASMSACNTIKNIVGYDNVKNYWIFKDNGSMINTESIKDYGTSGNNLTLSELPSKLNPSNFGLAYTLNIDSTNNNYYKVSDTSAFTLNTTTGAFTIIFGFISNNINETNTYLAQNGVFEIMKEYNSGYGIRFVLNMYGNNNSSLKCFTPYWTGDNLTDTNTLIISYNGDPLNPIVNFYINLTCITATLITETPDENTAGIINTNNFIELTTNTNDIASYLLVNNTYTNYINSQMSIITKIDNTFLSRNSNMGKNIALLMQSYMGNQQILLH